MRENKMKLYVIYDKVAEMSGPIFEAKNDQVAIRAFKQMVRGNSVVNPSDYELWQIGEIDQGNMQLELFKSRVQFEYEDVSKLVEIKQKGKTNV